MPILVFLLTLLLAPYWALLPLGISESHRGRIGIALVFAFTAVGHFLKTSEMVQMLPTWVPQRLPIVYATGVLEFVLGAAVLVPAARTYAGLLLCVFLILILPSNIYAAYQRLPFGGHEAGPAYLLIRIPSQFFLIGWIYWFTVRTE